MAGDLNHGATTAFDYLCNTERGEMIKKNEEGVLFVEEAAGVDHDLAREEGAEEVVDVDLGCAFAHGHEHGVGAGDGAEHQSRPEGVDVVCEPGGIAVAGLDDHDIAGDADGEHGVVIAVGGIGVAAAVRSVLASSARAAIEFGVADDVAVAAAVVGDFVGFKELKVAREGGLCDEMAAYGELT